MLHHVITTNSLLRYLSIAHGTKNRDVTFSREPRGTTTTPGFGGGKNPWRKENESQENCYRSCGFRVRGIASGRGRAGGQASPSHDACASPRSQSGRRRC